MSKLSKQGALQVVHDLERIATVFQEEHNVLGLPKKYAFDYALRTDAMADFIEKRAGIERDADGTLVDSDLAKYASQLSKRAMNDQFNYTEDKIEANEFNPAEIGEVQDGALLRNQDEPYMDVFKQDEFNQLREVQQNGMFSNAKAASALVMKMAKLLSDNNIKVPVAPQ